MDQFAQVYKYIDQGRSLLDHTISSLRKSSFDRNDMEPMIFVALFTLLAVYIIAKVVGKLGKLALALFVWTIRLFFLALLIVLIFDHKELFKSYIMRFVA